MDLHRRLLERLRPAARGLGRLYHPRTWKEKGLAWTAALLVGTWLVLSVLLGIYWSLPPDPFDVEAVARARAEAHDDRLVTGYVFTSTLMRLAETLLEKPGGYLSNDRFPPGVWLDNLPNWEYGVLVMLRDGTQALRNHFSRSQSQSLEDPDLARAEPQFNFQNDSWMLPATEREYRKGLAALGRYLERLSDPRHRDAQFYARADNLRLYLEIVSKRLGGLSQRLSASVGQVRVNTDLAGEEGAAQATPTPSEVEVRTPWLEIDDVFYEARGATWALLHLLRAIEIDFASVLQKKNAVVSLRQIIRELEYTQQPLLSPVVLNGSGFGLLANYSLTMANYIARANAALIDLRDLLQRG
ncbi:MAG: DUF2333 family protein [Gammaproteobacteria bacterium]|nr:MAG: DUF2333 family protein [Gammaproteobacteria bacterium]